MADRALASARRAAKQGEPLSGARLLVRVSGDSNTLRLKLSAPLEQEPLEVHGFSLRGVEVTIQYPLASGQELTVEARHPILPDALTLRAVTSWCRVAPGEGQPRASLEFLEPTPEQRRDIRRIQAAGMSCRVVAEDRTAGFLLSPAPDRWAIYDPDTTKVATLSRGQKGFQAFLLGHQPEESVQTLQVNSLPEAVAHVLELDVQPLIVPPEGGSWIPIRAAPAQPAPAPAPAPATRSPRPSPLGADASPASGVGSSSTASRAFHRILVGDHHVGFLSVMSVDDAWSLFDPRWHEVAIVTPDEAGNFRLALFGGSADESLDYMVSSSFLGAIQLAYGLGVEPALDPPLSKAEVGRGGGDPSSSSSVQRAAGSVQAFGPDRLDLDHPHHKVIDRDGDDPGCGSAVWVLHLRRREGGAR